jgi:hypothetical protein
MYLVALPKTRAFYASCLAVLGGAFLRRLVGGARRLERCWTEPLVGDPAPRRPMGFLSAPPRLLGCVLPPQARFRKRFPRPPSGLLPPPTEACPAAASGHRTIAGVSLLFAAAGLS